MISMVKNVKRYAKGLWIGTTQVYDTGEYASFLVTSNREDHDTLKFGGIAKTREEAVKKLLDASYENGTVQSKIRETNAQERRKSNPVVKRKTGTGQKGKVVGSKKTKRK